MTETEATWGRNGSTILIPGGQMLETRFRYADIYPYTVKLLCMAHSGQPSQPPPRIFPQSFDEIYSLREQLASFKVSIGRRQADQEVYYSLIKTLDSPEQVILDKYLDGGRGDTRYAIVPDEYPAALPKGASHLLMWYIDENASYSWVANKISEYFVDQRLTTHDFVVYRKPSNSGLFIPGFSRSIILPHVQLLVRDKESS